MGGEVIPWEKGFVLSNGHAGGHTGGHASLVGKFLGSELCSLSPE